MLTSEVDSVAPPRRESKATPDKARTIATRVKGDGFCLKIKAMISVTPTG